VFINITNALGFVDGCYFLEIVRKLLRSFSLNLISVIEDKHVILWSNKWQFVFIATVANDETPEIEGKPPRVGHK